MNGICDASLDLLVICGSVFVCTLVLPGATLQVWLSVAVLADVLFLWYLTGFDHYLPVAFCTRS